MDTGQLRRAIEIKRDGGTIDASTWRAIIAAYVAGTIDDAPVAALAMACTITGMADTEIAALTAAMVASGDVLEFGTERIVVDKHSSGGVGDAVSLAVVPLVAACGVPVAKLSGRALGHTGGTLNKLEAIPGVRTDLSPAEFTAQVERIGCAVAAQSERLVPADKRLYALRDRTGTVPCIGLIAASIVSKKLAGGAGAIVFDVKVGAGAFMRTASEAMRLAQTMVDLAARNGRRSSAIITDMNEPLASSVGTGLEVIEARDFLRGRLAGSRFTRLTIDIAQEMLRVAGVPENDVAPKVARALTSGTAYEQFVAFIEAQGGRRQSLEALRPAQSPLQIYATHAGYVNAIDPVTIGEAARELVEAHGPLAGLQIVAPVGTWREAGDPLARMWGSLDAARLSAAFSLGSVRELERPVITAVIRDATLPQSSKTPVNERFEP